MPRPSRARAQGPGPGIALSLVFLAALVGWATPAAPSTPIALAAHRSGELLIKFRSDASPAAVDAVMRDLGATRLRRFHRIHADHVRISRLTVEEALTRYRGSDAVEFVEPDYLVHVAETVPGDPLFPQQWALRNVGQNGGTPGADIDATRAWDVTTSAGEVIVAIIDTGVDFTHPDLVDNSWRNTGEIPSNGIDDDGNGYIDDVFGYDFANLDADPFDDNGHGTHVAGTIGATGDNGTGVAGVAWHVRLMPLKFLSQSGGGYIDGAVAAIEYAVDKGARILNNSWGGTGYSDALREAIADADAAGALFVAAAGNEGRDSDLLAHYPSGFDLPNVISVAASDPADSLAGFSNYGATSVDLAAPGVSILSTIPGEGYAYDTGTSMATPHVSGALALLLGRFPAMSGATARTVLLASADPVPALAGLVATGGRLNLARMLEGFDSAPPGPVADLAVESAGSNRLILRFTAPGDDGATGTASRYDLRYRTEPFDQSTFASATPATGVPTPSPGGTSQQIDVGGLATRTTYYFALRALDEYGNAGPVSNLATGTTLGPPDLAASPDSLSASLRTGGRAEPTLRLSNVGEGTLDFAVAPQESSVPMATHAYTTLAKEDTDPRVGDPVTADTGGPDRFGYRWADSDEPAGPAFAWVDASSVGEPVALTGDDATSDPVPIGFTFPFYGAGFTRLRVCTNGFLSFTSASGDFANQALPNAGAPENLVAPFWDDLYIDPSSSRIYRYFDGGRLIVEFQGLKHVGGGGPYTFEVILSPTGEIRFQYLEVANPATSATVGIQNGSRDDGLTIAFNTGYAHAGLAVRIAPAPRWLSVRPAQGTVPAGESMDLTATIDATGLFTGSYFASLLIRSNDPDTPEAGIPVSLYVEGAPDFAVAPSAVDFDSVFVGTEHFQDLIVTNTGSQPLEVQPDPIPAGPFTCDASAFSLAPGESRTISVRYAPAAAGADTATILFRTNDPHEPEVPVPLRGVAVPAPHISLSPSSFDETLPTGRQEERTLVVENTGASDLAFQISARDASVTAVPVSSTAAPAAGTAPADDPATWASFLDTGPAPKVILGTTGTHPEAALPVILVDPPDDGGPVDLVSLRASTGSGVLVVEMAFGTVLNPFDFGGFLSLDVDQNPATGLPPRFGNGRQAGGVEYEFQLYTVQLGFVRLIDRRTGQVVGNYAVTHDEHNVRFSAPLSALGGDDGRMNCSGVVGTSSAPTDWFPDEGYGIIGAVSWLSTRPSEGRLPPGGRLEVAVDLTTAGLLEGDYAARLRVESNDPDVPVALVPVNLRVAGIPDIAVSQDTLDFGTIYVGDTAARKLRVTNAGTGTLHVSGMTLDNPDAYVLLAPPFSLAPGERTDLEVDFFPLDVGAAPGSLHIQSDDPETGDITVALRGEAIFPPDIALEPDSLSRALLTGQQAEGTVTVRNEGLSDLRVRGATRRAPYTPTAAPARSAGATVPTSTREADPGPVGVRAASVTPGDPAVLVIQDTEAWGLDLGTLIHDTFGLQPAVISSDQVGATDFSRYDVIVTAGDEDDAYYAALSAHADQFERFVTDGGIVQYDVATHGANVFLAGGAQSLYADQETKNRVLLPQHPIAVGLPFELEADLINHCVIGTLPADARVITETFYSNEPTTVVYRHGRGTVIATGMTWEFLRVYAYPAGAMLTQSLAYALSLAAPHWLAIDPAEATIPAGGSAQFTVRFDAEALNGGDYSGFATFASNDPDEPERLTAASLHVTGAPNLVLDSTVVSFAGTFVGAARVDSLVVRNTGSDNLHVSIGSLDGVFTSAAFTGDLAPGAQHVARIAFAPPGPGSFTDTLRIASNDPDQPDWRVPLEGQGTQPPRAVIAPDSLADALPEGGGDVLTVSVRNEGEGDLALSAFARRRGSRTPAPRPGTAAGPSVLILQNTPAWSLDLARLFREKLGLAPTVIQSGQIDAVDLGAYDLVVTVGAQDAGYYYAISTRADRFAAFVQAGGVIQYQVFTYGSNLGLAGGARVLYGGGENANLVVAPGHPLSTDLPDTLTGAGLNSGTIVDLPTGARVLTTAAGSGAATTAEYPLGLGRVLVTAMPWEKLHQGSTAAAPLLLAATRYSIGWAYPSWLTISTAETTVPAGGSASLSVALSLPEMEGGPHAAEVVVETNDPDRPETSIPLALDVAGNPVLAVSPETIDFGSVYLGQSRTRSWTLLNPGTGVLRIASLRVEHPDYRVSESALDLPAYSRRTIGVTYAPGTPGPAPAALLIDHDATQGPRTVVLSGVGVPPPVAVLDPAAVTSQLVSGSAEERTLLVRNEGGSDLEFTAEPLNGAPAVVAHSAAALGKGEPDPRPGQASAEGRGGPDRYGYRWADSDEPGGPAFSWLDIRPSGIPIAIRDDDQTSAPQPIGFEFPFYGERFTQFRVCTNGWISFTSSGVDFTNQPLPSPGAPGNLLAPFWDDLNFDLDASAVRRYDGTKLVIQFSRVEHYGIGGPYTFQVVLYPNGTIVYQYESMFPPLNDATIGLQNADGTDGLTVAFNAPYLHGRMAIRFSPAPDWLTLDPTESLVPAGQAQPLALRLRAQGLFPGDYDARVRVQSNDPVTPRIEVPVRLHVTGVPDLAVAPAALDFDTTFVGTATARSLTLTNAGTEDLLIRAAASTDPEFQAAAAALTLPPLESAVLAVTFTPLTAGSRTAVLSIESNDPDGPVQVPLSATALVPPEASLLPGRIEAAALPGGRAGKALTLANRGGSDLRFEARSSLSADSGYSWRDGDEAGGPPFAWVDIRAVGTHVAFEALENDRTLGPLPIGFTFPFYGRRFDSFRVCTNGWISLTSDDVSGEDRPLPSPDAPPDLIAALWDDLKCGTVSGGGVWYGRNGDRLVVQFEGMTRAADPGAGPCSFEAILDPGGGILLQYRVLPGSSEHATVGIQNDLRDAGVTVVSHRAYLHEGLAVLLTPPASWITLEPEAGVLPAGGSAVIAVGLDASGLPDGDHAARIRFATNDPARPVVGSDVLLHVGLREAVSAEFNPGTVNLESNGRTMHARVELPPDLDPRQVVLGSVRLMDSVVAIPDSSWVGDSNRNRVPDLTLQFDRAAAEAVLPEGEAVPVRIIGEVRDRAWFVARDTVRAMRPHVAGPGKAGGEEVLPVRFALHPNSPNPFRPGTTIGFDLPRPSRVRLAVFDATGRLTRILVDAELPAGRHRAQWDGRTVGGGAAASGVYFARIQAGTFTASRRMLRIR